MFDLTGKVALVTGASGGIGSESCRYLSKQGCKLVISGTNLSKLESLAKEIGNDTRIEVCDLANLDEVDVLYDKASAHFEKIDIVVCNAGITRDNLSIRMSNNDFEEVIKINLTSSFILNRNACKKMMKQKWGRIINISSVVAFSGNAGQANYTASKAGLCAMTKTMAQEFASRGITINTIAPGFITTSMTDKLTEEQKGAMKKNIPMGIFGEARDIAAAVVYLSSDEAGYITGETIHVNGGMRMF